MLEVHEQDVQGAVLHDMNCRLQESRCLLEVTRANCQHGSGVAF